MWPMRDAICLDCRTALPAGHACHRMASLRDPDGRDALLDAVWGPKSFRRELRAAATAGVAGSSGFSLFDGCSGCDGIDLADWHVLVALVVVFAAVFLLWMLLKYVVELVRRRRHRLRAHGATRGPKFGRKGACGTIRAATTAADPITGQACIAFGVELRSAAGVMLRDGASLGFEIELDSGERVAMPRGPCAIEMKGGLRIHTAGYLAELDPLRARTDDLDPFPGNDARMLLLRPGDRVEVHGSLVPQVDPRAELGYRDVSPVLVPEGTPRLRAI